MAVADCNQLLASVRSDTDEHQTAQPLVLQADVEMVGPDWGAVAVFPPLRFPGPPSERTCALATHPALHGFNRLMKFARSG
jgi:hypothetical protein